MKPRRNKKPLELEWSETPNGPWTTVRSPEAALRTSVVRSEEDPDARDWAERLKRAVRWVMAPAGDFWQFNFHLGIVPATLKDPSIQPVSDSKEERNGRADMATVDHHRRRSQHRRHRAAS